MTAPTPVDVVETHCPYCALQCGIVARTSPTLSVVGNRAFPVNAGALCAKGWNAAAVVDHPERLREPLARDRAGRLVPVGLALRPRSHRPRHPRHDPHARRRCRRHPRQRRADQREGLPPRQVRPRRRRHRQHRLQRPLLHVVGRGGLEQGLRARPRAPLPARGSRGRRRRPPRRQQPGRDDAAVHALPRDAEGARRRARRDRSAPVGHRAAGDAAPAADAGHGHGARQRAAPRAAARRPGEPGLHRAAHRRLRQGPRRRRRLLAGARRARHRRAGEEDRRSGAAPRHVRPRLRADRARPRAAVAGRRQRALLHQHRARLRLPRHRGQRLRHPHRPGQRPGRPRARPEGRPAPRLSLDQRSGRPPRRRRRLARLARLAPRTGQVGLRAAPELRHRGRRPRPVRHGLQRAGLVAVGARGGSAARVARLPRRLRLLPLRDGPHGRRRPPVGAVGGGRRHDDQPRRPRHPPQARRRGADRRRLGHRRPGRPRRAPRQAPPLHLQHARRRVQRAGPRHQGRAGRLLGDHLRQDRRPARRLLAVPVARAHRHAAAVPRRLRDADRQGALPSGQAQAAGRDARQGLPALPDHRPRPRPVPVGHDDPPRAGAERDVGHGRRRAPPADGGAPEGRPTAARWP